MKGKPEVMAVLGEMLKEELGAISQYFLHSEMCDNWGYTRLSEFIKKQAIGEMKHAEILIERILFLEGLPNMGDLPGLNIGKDVKQQLQNDLELEKIGPSFVLDRRADDRGGFSGMDEDGIGRGAM